MASVQPHYCLNILAKKLNRFFILNQICQVNTIMMSSFFTRCSAVNASFPKNSSNTSLLNHLKIPILRHNTSHIKTYSQDKDPFRQRKSASVLNTTNTGNIAGESSHWTVQRAQKMTASGQFSTAASHLVWVDCEMNGLDPDQHCILEIAVIITDADLKVVDSTEIVIQKPEEILQGMDEWCTTHHTASGLVDKVRKSSISTAQADEMLTSFVSKHFGPRKVPMVGNSVYMDRMFILREFPKFNAYLHYRIIDISSLKELCKMYRPTLCEKLPKKRLKHRGLEDIEDTIQEFKFYKKHFLRTTDDAS